MKAAGILRYGDSSVLELVNIKKPKPGADEVLVRVSHAAVNPIELLLRQGHLRHLYLGRMPRILGSDFSGIVTQVGKSVPSFQDGDAVFGMRSTLQGGSYAEYVVARPDQICRKPINLTFAETAGLPLVVLTTWQALVVLARLKKGQRVLINGASGGVGVYAVQIAKALGANVVAVTSFRNQAMVAELGADKIIDYTQVSIMELRDRFDVFYDIYGNYDFSSVKHLLTPSGCFVTTIPKLPHFRDQILTMLSKKKAKVVVVKPNHEQLEKIRSLCEEGKIKPVIDSTFALNEIAEAHERLRTKRAKGKVIIEIDTAI